MIIIIIIIIITYHSGPSMRGWPRRYCNINLIIPVFSVQIFELSSWSTHTLKTRSPSWERGWRRNGPISGGRTSGLQYMYVCMYLPCWNLGSLCEKMPRCATNQITHFSRLDIAAPVNKTLGGLMHKISRSSSSFFSSSSSSHQILVLLWSSLAWFNVKNLSPLRVCNTKVAVFIFTAERSRKGD